MSTREGRRYVRTDRFSSLKDHVLDVVQRAGVQGATVEEVVRAVNVETDDDFTAYSNPVSGALSRLHNVDLKIDRLKEERQGFSVYVHPSHRMGREHHLPRPPDGREGDRLTPALVLEVLDGIAVLRTKFPERTLSEILNNIWRDANGGNVEPLQDAVDYDRGRP